MTRAHRLPTLFALLLMTVASTGNVWGWQTILSAGSTLPDGYAYSVASTPSGDVVAGGSFQGSGASQLVVVKLDGATGKVLWRHSTGAPADPVGAASRVVVGSNGDVVVLGQGSAAGQVRKLDGATGSLVWKTGIDPATFGYLGVLLDLALDPADDVVVGGYLFDDGSGGPPYVEEALVLKLSGATGALAWTQQGPLGTAWFGGVDPLGDVWITRGGAPGGTLDRLAGSDGSVVWSVPSGGIVRAFDAAGNAYLHIAKKIDRSSGAELWSSPPPLLPGNFSAGARVGSDVIIGSATGTLRRLAGADGSTLWTTALPIDVDYSGRMVATSDGGLLVTTGFFPFSTMRVDAATGALEWFLPVPTFGLSLGYDIADGGAGSAAMVGTASTFAVVRMTDRIAGQTLSLSDSGTQRLRLVAADPLIAAPSPLVQIEGPTASPVFVGADLTISNPLTLETTTLPLPAVGWRASRVKSNGRVVFNYSTPSGTTEPRTRVKIINGRLLKIRAAGALGFTLDEPTQGAIAVRLRIGGGVGPRYCVRFGGIVTDDQPHTATVKGIFEAEDAGPPATCD